MERLMKETALLKQQIQIMSKLSSPAASKVEVPPAVKQVMQRDPEEDKRILQILKDMDSANFATKKTVTKKRTVSKKKKAVEKAAPKVESKKVTKKKAATRKVTKSVPAQKIVEVKADKKPVVEIKKATPKKIVEVKADTKPVEEIKKATPKKIVEVKADTKPVVEKKKVAPRNAKKTVVPKKTAEVTTKIETGQDAVNPWASLSESTLKRKTVIQLTEYLGEREVKFTDDSGKILKKAELVTVLRSI